MAPSAERADRAPAGGVSIIDQDLRVKAVNRAFFDLLDLPADASRSATASRTSSAMRRAAFRSRDPTSDRQWVAHARENSEQRIAIASHSGKDAGGLAHAPRRWWVQYDLIPT